MANLISAEQLENRVAAIFCANGVPANNAAIIAQSLVDADRMGLHSHGVMLVEMYVERLVAGSLSATNTPKTVSDQQTAIVLDGNHGFGVIAGDHAMNIAIERAKKLGTGIVTVRHTFHFGAARRFAVAAAEQNCIGIAMCNTRPLMPAPGGAERAVGNNPIAIAIPSDDDIPLVLDMATSEAAMGKIRVAANAGENIPNTWAVNEDGSPTTNANEAIKGMLLPTAGPKGFGLALMIDLMSGLLSNGAIGEEVKPLYNNASTPYDCSHTFMAIHLGHFGDAATARARAKNTALRIRGGRRAPGVERLFTPGEREFLAAKANNETIEIGDNVLTTLEQLEARFKQPQLS